MDITKSHLATHKLRQARKTKQNQYVGKTRLPEKQLEKSQQREDTLFFRKWVLKKLEDKCCGKQIGIVIWRSKEEAKSLRRWERIKGGWGGMRIAMAPSPAFFSQNK